MRNKNAIRITYDRDAEDQTYFQRRVVCHQKLAEDAPSDSLRALHRHFADLYKARL